MRVLLVVILPFLLPALAYFGWWWWRHRAAVAAGRPEDAPGLGDAPVTALVAVGVGLMVMLLVGFMISGDGRPGDKYVPPRTVDGVIQPGYFAKPNDAQ